VNWADAAVAKEAYTSSEAALALGISLDTVRRWDRIGKIRAERTATNRRVIAASEVERLRGDQRRGMSARNRLPGVVRDVQIDGLVAPDKANFLGQTTLVRLRGGDNITAPKGTLIPLGAHSPGPRNTEVIAWTGPSFTS
jgi:excisionase family DNA binding protein